MLLNSVVVLLFVRYVTCDISNSALLNMLVKVKPVGGNIAKSFMPLTEIPPPQVPHVHSGRRMHEDCHPKPQSKVVYEGGNVAFAGEYYDERVAKTVATVIIPDHIDRMQYEVTTQVPYFTLGHIEAIGYHPTTPKGEHPSECEKIYQDHIADQYSEESTDYSEESLEMVRMPLFPRPDVPPSSIEDRLAIMYDSN